MRKPTVKSLKKKAESLWKEYAYLRDGKECQVKKYYPKLKIAHSNTYQVDHCISRGNKNLFLDHRNSTVVCSSCNMAKNYKNKSVDRAIDEIVIRREGLKAYDQMVTLDQSCSANPNFSKMWWLVEQIEKLEEMIKDIKIIKANPITIRGLK